MVLDMVGPSFHKPCQMEIIPEALDDSHIRTRVVEKKKKKTHLMMVRLHRIGPEDVLAKPPDRVGLLREIVMGNSA